MPAALYRARYHVDHIIAKQHGGSVSDPENLAWACLHCNSHKGPTIAGIDPESGHLSRLFHPRVDRWEEHFSWRGPWLTALTPVGATTIRVLAINDPRFVETREALIAEGVFPAG